MRKNKKKLYLKIRQEYIIFRRIQLMTFKDFYRGFKNARIAQINKLI